MARGRCSDPPPPLCPNAGRYVLMIAELSNRRANSFNHRHLNCFTFTLEYVAKLNDRPFHDVGGGGAHA
jgi:hypothetical protein